MTRKAALLVLIANALIAAVIVAGHAHWIAGSRTPRLAVIDVGELYRLMEARAAARLTKPDSTAEDRTEVLRQVGSFATELARRIEDLPHQCNCIVLVRGAVASSPGDVLDLTHELRRQLGL
jgi:hypothetical protein